MAKKVLLFILGFILVLFILIVVGGIIVEATKPTKEEISKMSDEKLLSLSDSEVDNLNEEAENLYYKRLDKMFKDEDDDNTDKNDNDLNSDDDSPQEQQVKKEVKTAMKKVVDKNKGYYDEGYKNIKVTTETLNGEIIADVEVSNKENATISDTTNLSDTDMKIYIDDLMTSFHDNGIPINFNKININLITHSWKNNGKDYVAKASANREDLNTYVYEAKTKIEKLN
jgi:hypothetical protein